MDRNTLIALAAVAAFFAYKFFKGKTMISKPEQMPKDSYTLVDVRTKEETSNGMLGGALNIPLDELPEKIKFMNKSKPVHVYCALGSRSSHAVGLLKQAGFEARNLGGYFSLKG